MIAVDSLNNPFRNEKGELVFRPGGHGALIENLNNLKCRYRFYQNIDNVIQNNNEKVLYIKALAGIVLEYQQQVLSYLNLLDDTTVEQDKIEEITDFKGKVKHANL
jgi:hypothetical protein